jgi:hypothetical protein
MQIFLGITTVIIIRHRVGAARRPMTGSSG